MTSVTFGMPRLGGTSDIGMRKPGGTSDMSDVGLPLGTDIPFTLDLHY